MSLSIDLRIRALGAYENQEGSIRTIAKRFKIGTATLVSWLKRKRSLGSISPGISSGRRSKFDEKGLHFLATSLEKNNEITLNTLAQGYERKYGIAVSLMTVHRACKRLDINYKKNSLSRRTNKTGSSSQTQRI